MHFVYTGSLCEYSFKRPWGTIRNFWILSHLMHDLFDMGYYADIILVYKLKKSFFKDFIDKSKISKYLDYKLYMKRLLKSRLFSFIPRQNRFNLSK